MKILILGSIGMAGHMITLYFKEQGYEVTAYSVAPFPYCENIIGNAFETGKFKDMILHGNYDIIINCIGLLIQASEERRSAALY